MLKGEHQSDEFRIAHPSGHIPVLADGVQSVYGTTLIQMTHLANRYKRADERLNMRSNFQQVNQLFAKFDARIRPVTSRIRRMILARAMKLKPEPTEEQYQKEMTELTNMILPMIDDLLNGKLYFCGSEITGFDL